MVWIFVHHLAGLADNLSLFPTAHSCLHSSILWAWQKYFTLALPDFLLPPRGGTVRMCPDIRGRPSGDHPQPSGTSLFTWSLQTAFCHLPAEVVLRPFFWGCQRSEPHGASALGSFWFPGGSARKQQTGPLCWSSNSHCPPPSKRLGKPLGLGRNPSPVMNLLRSLASFGMWFFFFLCKLPTLFSWIYALGSKGLGVLEAASAFCCAATLL